MKVLVVYAHPNPESFNHAILETLTHALRDRGHEVRVRDLYAEPFDPVLSPADLGAAAAGEPLPEDVRREQAAVAWAEVLAFIYPLWWFDRPAVLKGWFDRVFTNGFAFRFDEAGIQGLLRGKRAFVLVTAGGREADFEAIGAREHLLHPTTEGTLRFCGIEEVTDLVFYGVPMASGEARAAMLRRVARLAETLPV